MTCPHCLGAGCVHCREAAAERAETRRRVIRDEAERRLLGLMPRRPLRFEPEATPPPRRGIFGATVLPGNFELA